MVGACGFAAWVPDASDAHVALSSRVKMHGVSTVPRDLAPLLKVELGKVFSSARHSVTRRRTDDGERDRPARREPVADRHCSAIVGPSGSRPNSSSTLIACASSVRAAASSARPSVSCAGPQFTWPT